MNAPEGPLSLAELAELEGTLLPALERHRLRLLAHGLRSLQAISGRRAGPPPSRGEIEAWALSQPAVGGDANFAAALTDRLLGAAEQLREISSGPGALGLEIAELCSWAEHQVSQRLAIINPADPPSQAPP